MNLLEPWLLALALIAVPVVIAFLNRRRIKRRVVPSLVLLRQLQNDTPSKRSFAIPAHWLALLLCLLALIALAFAAADPVVEGNGPRTAIIVVDTSASMAAREDGRSRLSRGIARIEDLAGLLAGRDEVALIEDGTTARIVLEPSADRGQLALALKQLRTSGAPREAAQGLALAEALCRSRENATIFLVSDGASTRVPELSCPVQLVPVGTSTSNLAVTELAIRDVDTLGLVEVYVEVLNDSPEARNIAVDLEVDGVLSEVVTIPTEAGRESGRLVKLEAARGGLISARLADAGKDALAEDDVAWALRDEGARTRVLMISESNKGFTTEALRLHPQVDLTIAAPSELAAQKGSFDLLVLESAIPEGASLPPSTHVAVMGASPASLGIEARAELERPRVIWWSFDHPLFRFVDLDRVEIEAATPVSPRPGDTVLARTDGEGALVTLREREGRAWLIFGFAPQRSDLGLRVAFANFVANVVEWARSERSDNAPLALALGERVPGAQGGTLISLSDTGVRQRADAPVRQTGVYALQNAGGEEVRRVVVNLTASLESSLAPSATLANTLPFDVERASWRSDVWKIPVLIAVALLLLEWLLPLVRRGPRRKKKKAGKKTELSPTPARPRR